MQSLGTAPEDVLTATSKSVLCRLDYHVYRNHNRVGGDSTKPQYFDSVEIAVTRLKEHLRRLYGFDYIEWRIVLIDGNGVTTVESHHYK
ncbi:MAG TPA: hypothetical protein VLI92_01715 [Candidatus Saccharimonadales bacterium]|nr:hypothetical protein [Candidatus Saccharimonadales bacterium]